MPVDPKEYLKLGDWNAYCAGCNFKYKASELKVDWKGLYKCTQCWESRHPSDLRRTPPPSLPIPWSRVSDETAGRNTVADTAVEITPQTSQIVANPAGTFTANNEAI